MIRRVINIYNDISLPVKASLWFLICSFLQKGILIFTTPIYTNLFSTSEYGVYNMFLSWENLFSVIITMNLFYGMYSRGLVKYEDDIDKFNSSILGLVTTLILLWFCVYMIFNDVISNFLNIPLTYMLIMFILIFYTSIFKLWAARQRVAYKYKMLILITILTTFLNPVISIFLIYNMNDNVLARLLATVIIYTILYSWMFFSQFYKGKIFYSSKYWKHAIVFCIPLIPHYLSQSILSSSDKIMISQLVDSSAAGIYSLAYSVSLMMLFFNNAISQSMGPWIYKKIKDNSITDISNVAYITLIIIAGVNLCLIIIAPELVGFFAPIDYYDAIWIIPPVAMSAYFMFLYDLFAKFGFYFKKTKLISLASVMGALLNVVLNFYFLNVFGYIAAGYTTLVCYMLYTFLHFIIMKKICSDKFENTMPFDINKIVFITAIFLSMGFICLCLYKYFIIRYLYILVIIFLCYFKRKYIFESIKIIRKRG